MKINNKKGGYSKKIANEYIDVSKPIYSLSNSVEIQYKFVNNKPTDEINAYIAWFSQEGQPPFKVKFKNEVTLPKYLRMIEFEDLEACEVNYNVYFKAKNLKEIR